MATRPMPLHELPRQVGIDTAMAVIAKHHERIARRDQGCSGAPGTASNTSRSWCMNGGDGFGNARVGFKPEVVSALLSLISLHQVDR